jgi:hypothetical protein
MNITLFIFIIKLIIFIILTIFINYQEEENTLNL